MKAPWVLLFTLIFTGACAHAGIASRFGGSDVIRIPFVATRMPKTGNLSQLVRGPPVSMEECREVGSKSGKGILNRAVAKVMDSTHAIALADVVIKSPDGGCTEIQATPLLAR